MFMLEEGRGEREREGRQREIEGKKQRDRERERETDTERDFFIYFFNLFSPTQGVALVTVPNSDPNSPHRGGQRGAGSLRVVRYESQDNQVQVERASSSSSSGCELLLL